MPFPHSIREEALLRSHRYCCICHKFAGRDVNVHHIIQEADGGLTILDNAIVLCLRCHSEAGHYNVKHPIGTKYSREELKRHRDQWWEHCRKNPQGIALNQAGDIFSHLIFDFTSFVTAEAKKFVGREFIFKAVDKFIKGNDAGYFTLIADAGLGKTAIAAAVTSKYNAVSFFFSGSQGITKVDECLKHISASLISHFDLNLNFDFEHKENSFVFKKVVEAASHATLKPLLIVIDAVDESDGTAAGQNILRLPESLPKSCYIILTRRAGVYPLTVAPGTKSLEYILKWNDKGQQKDIEEYLRHSAIHNERIAQVLDMSETSIDAEIFVEKLKAASQGNFKYVEYILESIGSKEIGIEEIDSIPQGLQTYYDQIWNNIKQSGNADGWLEWDGLFRPVIALLAAATEPVSVQWLADITGKNYIEIRERAIDKWQRYLTREVYDDKETWRVIHKSFADFIEDKIELFTAHKSIINYYYDYAERWHSHQNYALRQLSAHLFEVNDFEKLSKLIDNQEWYKVQVESDPSAASYMQDIDRLSSLYENIDTANLKHKKTLKMIGKEVKCAFINGSLCTISSSITPTVLKALIQYGYWSPEQVLNVVLQISEDRDKEAAISEVAEYIPADLFDDVLKIVNGIIGEEGKVEALRNLLPYVPKIYNRKLLEIVFDLRDYGIHRQILHSVVPSLTLADFEKYIEQTIRR